MARSDRVAKRWRIVIIDCNRMASRRNSLRGTLCAAVPARAFALWGDGHRVVALGQPELTRTPAISLQPIG
jgi:hypothetical protein